MTPPPDSPHPEDVCDACGGPNVNWSTPRIAWNAVVRAKSSSYQEDPMLCPRCFAVKADEVLGERHWRLLEATNPLSALEQSDQDLERARVQDVTVYAMCRAGATANRIIQRLVQEKQALERSIVDYATQTGIHVPMRQMEVRLHREGEDLTGRLLCPGCEHSFPDPEGTALDKASAVRCMNCGRPVRRCE